MKVLVTGGTGFIGRRLVDALADRGDLVTVVSRDPAGAQHRGRADVSYRGWLPQFDPYDAVVNLCGEWIFARRWNAAFKATLRTSRVDVTRRIVEAFDASSRPPGVLVNASAIGYYGSRGAERLTEDSSPGGDFLAQMCVAWEDEAEQCRQRSVRLRIGVVLGLGGGALAEMLPVFRLGLGGPIGLGGQAFSWVHADDVVGLIVWALDNPAVSGAVNATSPGVVSNREFSRALGRVLRRPAFLPVPPLALRLKFGEVASVLTASQHCVPQAALDGGYAFRHTEVEPALRSALGRT